MPYNIPYKKMLRLLLFALSLACLVPSALFAEVRIICASTTSTLNSGLFDRILPPFEKKSGIKVHVVAVGTGAAIEMGKRGDADVVFVHAKEQELKAVEEGHFVNRHDVMYNDFVIIGPREDPAKLKASKSALEAFKKIAVGRIPFVSRGDNSGTHTMELSLWKKTAIAPKGQAWYIDAGQGMEKTLRIAGEKRAYALADRGTWLAAKDRDNLDMAIVFEGDPALLNQYGAMAANPEKHGHVKYKEAMEFVNYLVSDEGQKAIGSFTDKGGNKLFLPNAK